jgi:hypothetical protein
MDPAAISFSKTCLMWSEWLESVRKDVECTFGILKARFRFLKGAIRYHSPDLIEESLKTCAILHNILLEHDHLDHFNWENINENDEEMQEIMVETREINTDKEGLFLPSSSANEPMQDSEVIRAWHSNTYLECKQVLNDHFARMYFTQQLMWPRAFSAEDKKRNCIKFKILSRVLGATARDFYVAPTSIYKAGCNIGYGLFADTVFYAGETLLYFEGRLRTWQEMYELEEAGAPNKYYTVQITANLFLDCYLTCKKDVCLASYANSPQKALNISNKKPAKANSKLVVNQHEKTAKLVATKLIKRGDEVLWRYGQRFSFTQEAEESLLT